MNINQGIETGHKLGGLNPISSEQVDSIGSSTLEEISSSLDSKKITAAPIENLETDDYPNWKAHCNALKDNMLSRFFDKFGNSQDPYVIEQIKILQARLEQIKIKIIDINEVNAFCITKTGKIMITTAFLKKLKAHDSQDTLAFIIGHEIGHIVYENMERFQDYQSTDKNSQTKNSLNMEFECDKFALELVDSIGLNVKYANLDILEKSDLKSIDVGILSSHPNPPERNKHLKELILSRSYENYQEDKNTFQEPNLEFINLDSKSYLNIEQAIRMNSINNFFERCKSQDNFNSIFNCIKEDVYEVRTPADRFTTLLNNFDRENESTFHAKLLEMSNFDEKYKKLAEFFRNYIYNNNITTFLEPSIIKKYNDLSDEDLVLMMLSSQSFSLILPIKEAKFLIDNLMDQGVNELNESDQNDFVKNLKNCLNDDSQKLIDFVLGLEKDLLKNIYENSSGDSLIANLLFQVFNSLKGKTIEIKSKNTGDYFELVNNLHMLKFNFNQNNIIFNESSGALSSVLNDVLNSKNFYAIDDFLLFHKSQISELIINEIKNGSNELFVKVMDADKYFFNLDKKTKNFNFLDYFLELENMPESFEEIQPQVLDILFSNVKKFPFIPFLKTMESSFLKNILTPNQKTYLEKSCVLYEAINDSNIKIDALLEYIDRLVTLDIALSEIPMSNDLDHVLIVAKHIKNLAFLNKEKLVKKLQNTLYENFNHRYRDCRTFNSNFEVTKHTQREFDLALDKEKFEKMVELLNHKKDWKGFASLVDNYFKDTEGNQGLEQLRYLESLESFDIPILNHKNYKTNLSLEEVIESDNLTLGDYAYYLIANKADLLKPKSDDSQDKLALIKNLIAKFKRPSCVLDKLICSNIDQDIFEQLSKDEHDLLLKLVVKSPIKAGMIGKLYYEKYISTCQDFDSKKQMILKSFPKASKHRDDLLQNLILSSNFKPSELISLDKDLFTKYNSEFLRNGTIIEGSIGSFVKSVPQTEKLVMFKEFILKEEPENAWLYNYTLDRFLEESGFGKKSIHQMISEKETREIFINDLINCEKSMLTEENCKVLVEDLFKKLDCINEDQQIMTITKAALSAILLRSSKDKSAKLLNKITNLIFNNEYDFSKVIKEVFVGLGVIGVKLGQIIASQPFVKEKSINLYNALSELKDQAEPMDLIEILESIKVNSNLHDKNLVIERILASASIKSVLKAKIDEEDVVLKILKPNSNKYLKEAKSELDLIFDDLAPLIQQEFDIEIPDLASEIIEWIQEETDFENETQNLSRMKDDTESMKLNLNFNFYVPQIKESLSSFNMLAEDIVPGIPLKNIDDIDLKRRIYKDLQLLITQQLFVDGFFHADLHDGNIFFDHQTQTISLIDAGFCSKLSHSLQILLLNLIDKKGNINFMIQRYLAENGRLLNSKEIEDVAKELSQESSYFKKLVKIQEFFNSMEGFAAPTELTRTVAGLTKCAHIFDTIDFSLTEIISQFNLARSVYSVSPYFVETQLIKFLNESEHSIARIGNILTGPLKISPANLLNYIIRIIDKKIEQNDATEISIRDFLDVLDDNPNFIKIKKLISFSGIDFETAIKVLAGMQESTGKKWGDFIIKIIKKNLDNPGKLLKLLSKLRINSVENIQDSVSNQLHSGLNSIEDLTKVSLSEENYSQILEFVITLNLEPLKKINFDDLDKGVVKLINSQINTLIAKIEDFEELNQLEASFENISENILNRKIQLIGFDKYTIFELVNLNESNPKILKIIDKKLEDYFETFSKIRPIKMSDYPDFFMMKSSLPVLDKKIINFLKSINIEFEFILNIKVRQEIFDSYLENMSSDHFAYDRILTHLERFNGDLLPLHEKLVNKIVEIQIESLERGKYVDVLNKQMETQISKLYHKKMDEYFAKKDLAWIKNLFEKFTYSNSLCYNLSKRILNESVQSSNNFNKWKRILGKLPQEFDFKKAIKDFIKELDPPINDLIIGFTDYNDMQWVFSSITNLTLVADPNTDNSDTLKNVFEALQRDLLDENTTLTKVDLINVNVNDFITAFKNFHQLDLGSEVNFKNIQTKIFKYLKNITFADTNLDRITLPNFNPECKVSFPSLIECNKIQIGTCEEIILPSQNLGEKFITNQDTKINIVESNFIADLIKFGTFLFDAVKLNKVLENTNNDNEVVSLWNEIKDIFSELELDNLVKLKFKNTLFKTLIKDFIENNTELKKEILTKKIHNFEDDLYKSDFYSVFSEIIYEKTSDIPDEGMIKLAKDNEENGYYIDCLLKNLFKRNKLNVFLKDGVFDSYSKIYKIFDNFAKANLSNHEIVSALKSVENISNHCNVQSICSESDDV